ncbi:MAG: prepilin-type N-terminal cleavage/methylation domain-containing protein [Planctomycetota bacterium]|nr:prepilin-type N-terminal cleavage/methylation domain-containing protein [Planctomycetota bacterium]
MRPVRRKMLPGASHGFTLIEVILAIALSVLIVFAVARVTQSSLSTARTVKQASATDMRVATALNILKRDLQGWYQPQANPPDPASRPSAWPESGELLLSFATLADSLAVDSGRESTSSVTRSIARVSYLVQPRGSGFDLVRREDASPGDITLLTAPHKPTLEFYDGKNWVERWQRPNKPRALRLHLVSRTCIWEL